MNLKENQIIAALPRAERRRFIALCDEVPLIMSAVLAESGNIARYAYFPTAGFISLVTAIDGQPVLEVGMMGTEGMLGAQLALGAKTAPLHAVVQGAGSAWRVAAVPFRRELAANGGLRGSLDRYLYLMMVQLAAASACLRYHEIGPRLARWLLMTQDRAHSAEFHVTHEFLAFMLGVRRVGVTAAAAGLRERGFIDYRRGDVTVLNRRGLESAACSCYAADNRAYKNIMQ